MERRSIDPVADQLYQLLPDRDERRWVLERFAEGLAQAHAVSPGAWVLSFRRDRRALRLVVGRILVFGVCPRGLFLALDVSQRGARTEGLALRPMFDSAPAVLGGWNPLRAIRPLWPELTGPFLAAIEHAASSVQRTPYAKGWSEALSRVIGTELGRTLPRPSYRTDVDPPPKPVERGWKISPEVGGKLWDAWRDGAYISIGWPHLGDLSTADRAEFDRRAAACSEQYGWSIQGQSQVWRFARELQIGDLVFANEGTRAILGIGRITGGYEFVTDDEHPHRRRVEWLDTRRRPVEQPGWVKTLFKLSPALVKELTAELRPTVSRPFERISTHLRARGLYFPDEQIADYLLALQTRRFVILTGISGTGKTKIAQSIVECFPAQRIEPRAKALAEDSLTWQVQPYSLRHRRMVIPQDLVRLLDAPLVEEGTGRRYYHIEYPEGRAKLTIWQSDDLGVTVVSFRQPFSTWFTKNLKEGDLLALTPFEVDGAMVGIRYTRPGVQAVATRIDNCAVVAVRPDWTDNRGLLGFYNPITERYRPTPFLRLLLDASLECTRAEAEQRTPQPFFVILDEMNLARVEHYFSDFLSCMESGEPLHLHDDPRLEEGESEEGTAIPRRLTIPHNLFFTGTVNVDETTYMFSPKVLDRAFTLEFDEVDLSGLAGELDEANDGLRLDAFDGTLHAPDKPSADDWAALGELAPHLRERLITLNTVLAREHRHFGYRVANEMARFVVLASEQAGDEPATLEAALDLAVMHKVLPKLHGTQQELDTLLQTLFAFALGERPDALRVDVEAWSVERGRLVPREGDDLVELPELSMPRTAAKLWRMWRRLRQRGFTSFIEG